MTTPTSARSDRRRAWGRVAVGLTTVALAGGLHSSASAGGWAVSTLDELPVPRAGETVDVGFTIRQHGVTPVAVDGVGIRTRSSAGVDSYFEAKADGSVGHYVATVTFPTAGAYTWSVRQGWFADHDLGVIDVATASDAEAGRDWSAAWRYGLPAGAVTLAAIALFDAAAARRRRGVPA